MEQIQLERLATLRSIIGYLGEREQYGWWQSSFFAPGSRAFLAPVFGRTQMLAQCNGVSRAASLIHDAHIGVGDVYHLFRLPEDIEQGIHRTLHDQDLGRKIASLVTNKAAALDYLRQDSSSGDAAVGPTRTGNTQGLRQMEPWSIVATQYAHAFDAGSPVYPYFADRA